MCYCEQAITNLKEYCLNNNDSLNFENIEDCYKSVLYIVETLTFGLEKRQKDFIIDNLAEYLRSDLL